MPLYHHTTFRSDRFIQRFSTSFQILLIFSRASLAQEAILRGVVYLGKKVKTYKTKTSLGNHSPSGTNAPNMRAILRPPSPATAWFSQTITLNLSLHLTSFLSDAADRQTHARTRKPHHTLSRSPCAWSNRGTACVNGRNGERHDQFSLAM